MKLNAGVRRAGEASTTENADLHAKVAAILLRHQICRGLGGTKERMERPVDSAVFVDTVVVFRPSVFPSCI